MKAKPFLIVATAGFTFLAACQNSTKNADEQSSAASEMDTMMHSDTAAAHSGMMGAMKNMMQDMHQMQPTGNVDVDFASMMKSHHEGALAMARIEVQSGQDATLKQMAQKIIESQQAEIKELQAFIDAHPSPEKNYDPAKKETGFAKAMDESMKTMMNIPTMDHNASTDSQFVQMMIPHHQSAVEMANGYIQFGEDAKLITMAKKMVEEQKREIEEFKNLKR
jgi:uncharacterized protein (DUF305 family)